MNVLSRVTCHVSLVVCLVSAAHSVPLTRDQGQATSDNFAIIISGAAGDSAYSKRFTTWAETLYGVLQNQLHFPEDHIFYLTAAPSDKVRVNAAKATAEAVRVSFEQVKAKTNSLSQVFIFLIGHGSYENQQAKFNLVGPDLTPDDFNQRLDALPTKHIVLINTASASGAFISALSQPSRIIMTATRSGYEQNATTFAEFFLQAFKENQADLDKNNRVSVFEAFTYATQLTEQWYQQAGRLATEHALLDDNGDKVGHGGPVEGDGILARTVYFDSIGSTRPTGDAVLLTFAEEKERFEQAIEALKARKAEMDPTDYAAELERLLVQLAQVNQKIKARQE